MLPINSNFLGLTMLIMFLSPLGCAIFMINLSRPLKITNMNQEGPKTNIFKISKTFCQILKYQLKRNLVYYGNYQRHRNPMLFHH